MYDKHWTDEELIARLYDVRLEDSHLRSCVFCTQRLDGIRRRHEYLRASQIAVPPEFLAAQRRAIREKTSLQRRSPRGVLIPAAAALMVLAIMIVYRSASVMPPPEEPVSDSELFDDVFSRISDPLPTSAEPIRSLFEEQK
jgi:hypothetical protein